MKRIIITVPRKKEKWMVSGLGTNAKRFANVNTAFNWIERRLNVPTLKQKTAIRVKYGNGINESLNSKDPLYLLQCLTAFLEDHISRRLLINKTKRYYVGG